VRESSKTLLATHVKDPKPTSLDIAHLAGVSQPTVSRALRNSPLVSEATRKKVQEVARKLNYKVDVNARNLRSQRNNTIALLLCEDPDSSGTLINPFFLSMMGSITRAAARAGYDVLISFQQLSDDWLADYEDANKADGIIFLGYGDYTSYANRIQALDEMNAHFITWGPVIEGQPGHFLGCNNAEGGYSAADHLLQLGRRNIAFLGDISEDFPEFHERYRGYVEAHEAHDAAPSPNLVIPCDSNSDHGFDAANALLESGHCFDAVFCASDLIAIGAMKAFTQAGLKLPQDVAVVGFDDIHSASFTSPALTTVKQKTVEAGEELVDSILKLIAGEDISSRLLPTELIVRESCGGR